MSQWTGMSDEVVDCAARRGDQMAKTEMVKRGLNPDPMMVVQSRAPARNHFRDDRWRWLQR